MVSVSTLLRHKAIRNLMFTNLSSRRGPFLLFVFFLALSAGRAFANEEQVGAALGQGGKVVLLRHTHVDMREGIGHLAPQTARRRAETFVAHEIRGSPPTFQAADREPTRLAVFAFELEDTSAAAPSMGESAVDAADAAELTKVTDAVRQMLAQSPRYRVIDVGGADADSAKAHVLHDCGGCDAGVALGLGADQSLVGVIRRVSRTEYTIRFQVREARTGAVVASADSGLRMGASYSWSRGAVRLISDRLLETQSQQ
jgi:Protein of unknown function (DUF2380)